MKTTSIVLLSLTVLASLDAKASSITFCTAATSGSCSAGAREGNGAGLAVNASATVTTNNGSITVLLNNLQSDPTADNQAISGFLFTLSGAPGTLDSVAVPSLAGPEIDLSGHNTTAALKDWSVGSGTLANQIYLNGLFGTHGLANQELILGPGPYTNANGSLTNNQHQPFIQGTETFTFNATGVTTATVVNAAIFAFSTSTGDHVTGVTGNTTTATAVPEPTTAVMFVSGLALLGVFATSKKSGRTSTKQAK